MSFVEPVFFLFLISVLSAYYSADKLKGSIFGPDKGGEYLWAYYVLIIGSISFYAYSGLFYLLILIGVSLISFMAGKAAWKVTAKGYKISLSIIIIFVPLFFYKYYDFFKNILSLEKNDNTIKTILPIGISFFTFQNIAYVVGRYRNKMSEVKRVRDYILYITFFPQLIAGPIVNANQFIPQLKKVFSFRDISFQRAAFYLIGGYIKKTIFADRLALIVDPVFAAPESFGSIAIFTALLAYGLQIYFDFSGYSDMAIGLGHLFGFHLPENFNFPYSATSLRQFWRRWHITLSIWLRDHLYISLGGNRRGTGRLIMAVMVTMILGGLWHGAHLNFIIWGFAHGLLLLFERLLFGPEQKKRFFEPIYGLVTFCLVTLLWVPFRTGSMVSGTNAMIQIYSNLFTWRSGPYFEFDLKFTLFSYILLFLVSRYYGRIKSFFFKSPPILQGLIAALSTIFIIFFAGKGEAFIYFVF